MGLLPFGWYGVPRELVVPPMSRVRYRTINATDGTEQIWRDAKGRITRHIVRRASKPYKNECYKYVRRDGRVERVTITLEEWERRNGRNW